MALRALLTRLHQDPVFVELCQRVSNEPKLQAWLSGLWGTGRAFFWAGLREKLRRPMLLLVPTPEDARELYDQLSLFLQHPDPEREELFLFPGREILPYENALTDMEMEGERLEVLHRLLQGENLVVVAAFEQAREIVAAPGWLKEKTLVVHKGQHMDLGKLADMLVERGYTHEAAVEARGQFSIRGGIVDVFPPAELSPWRIEFEGTEVCSLRRFSLTAIETTMVTPAVEAIVTPARLFAPSPQEVSAGLAVLDQQRGRELVRPLRQRLEADPQQSGLENYLPYLIPTARLLDYWPSNTLVMVDSPADAQRQAEKEDQRIQQMYAEHKLREPILPPPEVLRQPFAAFGEYRERFTVLESGRLAQSVWAEPESLARWQVVLKGTEPLRGSLDLLIKEVQALTAKGLDVHVVTHNVAEEKRLRQLIAEHAADLQLPDILGQLTFHLGQVQQGFQYPACALAVYSDQEIFQRRWGRPPSRRLKGHAYSSQPIADVLELKPGDLAVHRDHGIAQYHGVVKLRVDGHEQEFICLAYANDEKLYVPTDQLRLVERYVGGERAVRIHRLGSASWERTKQRVRESVVVLARQLLDIYAARQVNQAHAFPPDTSWQREFEEAFVYEETPDQARAIVEVKRDLEYPRPMDRLICGDVGFGKTEIAMRAAFKVVQDKMQVAVLVPTTILADQHYATFRERMAAYPIRIELFSRFRSPAEQTRIRRELAEGQVDIVIGTHKLLSQRVQFQHLGLMVLDEEQHFGVAQKEKLKQLRSTVDVLTLTATPIPRTLYLSLSGIRDISVIETPPLNRLPIRTQVLEYSETVIREAILRELARNGQVFFIHNRIQNIGAMAERVKQLVPEARVAVAHGQMSREQLEPVMERFLARAEDILVSTTIVESGLDMPNVNTIVINRADAMGLAQLYQLRGRVGRADRQAYAYLFYPVGGAVTRDAEKRLLTLQEFTELGSGIKIAMRDLEIRGAGDILGPEQSGQVAAVGFETYCSLLEEAVRELRGQRQEGPPEVRLSLPVDAYLPSEYIPDTMSRLNWYKRLAGARKTPELQNVVSELESRYGRLPTPAVSLVQVADIRLQAHQAGLKEIAVDSHSIRLLWPKYFQLSKAKTESLLGRASRRLRFIPGDQPGLEIERPAQDLLEHIKNFLSELV